MNLATATNASALLGATNGLYYTGGAFGSLFSGYIIHKYRRKKYTALSALIILISSALVTGSVHIGIFMLFFRG
jgi:hypothetical protein